MSKLADFFWRGKKPQPKPLTEARIRAIVREEFEAVVKESLDLSPPEQSSCSGRAAVARLAHNQKVAGSIPAPATLIRGGDAC